MPRDTLDEISDENLLVLYANGDPDAARRLQPHVERDAMAFHATRLGRPDRAQEHLVAPDP